jgi:hypothetical protein
MNNLSILSEGYDGTAFSIQNACPICNSSSSAVLFQAINIHPAHPCQFDLRSCGNCKHAWIDPMPTQGLLSHLYERGSRSVIGEWGQSNLTMPERFCADQELKRAPGKYLELGVGQGHLYQLFLQRGWICTGVDPGDWSKPFPNVVPDISEVQKNLSANLVAAFDVLEHVADPISVLRSVRKLMAVGAKLYCAMPNALSFRATRHKAGWRMVRPLGHVNYYTRKSISLAMTAAGFNTQHIHATDLNELHIPRNFGQLKSAAVELLGIGDQLVVMAKAI